MAWVEGQRLDRFVENHLDRPDILYDMAARWRGANGSLRGLGIAHNDLQHGNVMVQSDDAIRLVDYDAIFLPKFQGENSPEMGHKNFQHPLRAVQDYSERIDNFPSLVLYLSLLAISSDPGLWEKFYNQENLIFTKQDFAAPNDSECFKALRNIGEANVAELAGYLAECCSRPVELVPNLESILQGGRSVPPPAPVTPIAPVASPALVTPPVSVAPPAPVAPTTSGGTYRELIQAGQVDAPETTIIPNPPPPDAIGPVIQCPRCKQPNPAELIYCANENCTDVLHADRKTCRRCHYLLIPINALFCTECGVKLTTPPKP